MERELSERALREEAAAKHSKRGGFFGKKPRSARIQTGAGTRFEYSSGKRRFIPRIEKAPPKSLVLIWIVVTVELMMDLVTTIISFAALVQEDDCCGECAPPIRQAARDRVNQRGGERRQDDDDETRAEQALARHEHADRQHRGLQRGPQG